jgi:uncharacterized phage protein gp47/JayE
MPHGEFFEIGVAELLVQKPELSEEVARAKGTTFNALLHIAAAMAEEIEWEGAKADADGFLDTARGAALTRYVASEYGVQRAGLTAAVVELTCSHTDDSDTQTLPAGTVVSSGDGTRFTTDIPAIWDSGDISDKTVFATSVQLGPDNNVDAGTITTIETALDDLTITVTNPARAAGGNLAETDEDLVARVRDVTARAVRGTVTAIRLGGLEVDEVREVSVFENVDAGGDPTGGVSVVVSDTDGNGNEVLAELVLAELMEWRPAGSKATVIGATPRLENIAVTLVWDPGQATAANVELAKAAIRARVNRLDPRAAPADATPEDTCLLTQALIYEVRPLVPGLKRMTVTVPAGTVEPDTGEVIRAGTVTVS